MYRITIWKIEEVETMKQSYERVADTGNKQDGGAVYAYVKYPSVEELKTEILSQTVEGIDIAAVIKAVNGLK